MTRRLAILAATTAAILIVVGLSLSARQPTPGASSTATATLAAAATRSPTVTTSPAPTPATASPLPSAAPGTITGRLGYPSDFVPPVTVYAISVSDSGVWFSTDTPRFGNPLSATPPPGGPTWPPTGPGTYSISGIQPGTYYVIAYRNDNPDPPQLKNYPGIYTRWASKCASSDPSVPTPPPGPCRYENSLLPVTVATGQAIRYIDIVDWFFRGGDYPPRPR